MQKLCVVYTLSSALRLNEKPLQSIYLSVIVTPRLAGKRQSNRSIGTAEKRTLKVACHISQNKAMSLSLSHHQTPHHFSSDRPVFWTELIGSEKVVEPCAPLIPG